MFDNTGTAVPVFVLIFRCHRLPHHDETKPLRTANCNLREWGCWESVGGRWSVTEEGGEGLTCQVLYKTDVYVRTRIACMSNNVRRKHFFVVVFVFVCFSFPLPQPTTTQPCRAWSCAGWPDKTPRHNYECYICATRTYDIHFTRPRSIIAPPTTWPDLVSVFSKKIKFFHGSIVMQGYGDNDERRSRRHRACSHESSPYPRSPQSIPKYDSYCCRWYFLELSHDHKHDHASAADDIIFFHKRK